MEFVLDMLSRVQCDVSDLGVLIRELQFSDSMSQSQVGDVQFRLDGIEQYLEQIKNEIEGEDRKEKLEYSAKFLYPYR